jgi:hypothetical protein
MASDGGAWELQPGYWLVTASSGGYRARKFLDGTAEDAERCRMMMLNALEGLREEIDTRFHFSREGEGVLCVGKN